MCGSPGRTRTCGTVVNSHLLYRLSYRGLKNCISALNTLQRRISNEFSQAFSLYAGF